MYSFVYFSFFTNLSKILAVAVRLLFEKDFEYLSIDLYLLQDWSKHFYTRVVFFIRERLQKNLYFYERFYYQTVLRNFRHREISCLATQLGSIPPKEVPGFLKKPTLFSSFFSQDTFRFQFVMDFWCFFPFFLVCIGRS